MIRAIRIFAAVATGLYVGAAQAQTPDQPAAGQGGLPEPTLVEQHGSWIFECSPTDQIEFCTMQQVLSNSETKEVLLGVTIAFHPVNGELLMVAMAPLGVDLPVGVGMRIDQGQQMAAPYTNCTQPGCRATAPLSDELVAAMKGGNTMLISYSFRGQRFDAPVSLTGFTAAHGRLVERKATLPNAPAAAAPAPAPSASAPARQPLPDIPGLQPAPGGTSLISPQ